MRKKSTVHEQIQKEPYEALFGLIRPQKAEALYDLLMPMNLTKALGASSSHSGLCMDHIF